MIIWQSRAEQELQDIYDYVFLDSPQNADELLNTLISIADGLSKMPYQNPKDPYYDSDNVRFVAKWNYKIIYLIGDIDIFILSVFNTSQGSFRFRK